MITFLLEEGVLSVGVLSGLFTTSLLNSLKQNIIEPGINKLVPPHFLDIPSKKEDKSDFADIFPIPIGSNEPQSTIKWQTFLKDFITWLLIMFCLYLFWKKVLHPFKMSKN